MSGDAGRADSGVTFKAGTPPGGAEPFGAGEATAAGAGVSRGVSGAGEGGFGVPPA